MVKYDAHCIITRAGAFAEFGQLELGDRDFKSGTKIIVNGVTLGKYRGRDPLAQVRKDGVTPTMYIDATDLERDEVGTDDFNRKRIRAFASETASLQEKLLETNVKNLYK